MVLKLALAALGIKLNFIPAEPAQVYDLVILKHKILPPDACDLTTNLLTFIQVDAFYLIRVLQHRIFKNKNFILHRKYIWIKLLRETANDFFLRLEQIKAIIDFIGKHFLPRRFIAHLLFNEHFDHPGQVSVRC